MSFSSLDYQMSLRQISEGVRRQEKTSKRQSVDKDTKTQQTEQNLNITDIEQIKNKERELPLSAKSSVGDATQKVKKQEQETSSQKKIKRLRENFKGNFLDIEVE